MSEPKRRLRRGLARIWASLPPSPRAKRAGAAAAIVFAALLAAFFGAFIQFGFPGFLDPLSGIALGLILTALVGGAVYLAIRIVGLLPRFYSLVTLAAIGSTVFVLGMSNLPGRMQILAAVGLVTVQVLLAGAVAAMVSGGFGRMRPGRKAYAAAVLALALGIDIYVLQWFFKRGVATEMPPVRASAAPGPALDLPDPAAPGPFRVLELTYGSGTDKRRPEYGKAADLVTEPVDATPFIKNNKGWRMSLRRLYWGFGFDAFPVNGRVWHPEGDGPFPLALIVHGNHKMEQYSDSGYEYLGRLLASRGFIFVSIDENFFNGSFRGGLRRENDGRGWMLLQHLKAWRTWADTPGNPFHGRVDMDRIALIGHSRGGEAAAIAACFNRLTRYPDDATVAFDFGFAIRGVVAIAPSDGQYLPADRPTPLEDVSYLVLQGAYDADVSSFSGDKQFQRVRFTGKSFEFAASLYARRANHGQFNMVWGDSDWGWPGGFALNRTPLLSPEDQRKISSVYISAFLETVLRGQEGYLPLFRDSRAGAAWLPEDVYVSRYRDSTFRAAADFEEDVDVSTASVPGASIAGTGLAVWREQDLPFRRSGGRRNQVAYIGWRAAGEETAPEDLAADDSAAETPDFSVVFEPGALDGFALDRDSLLTFGIAATDEDPPKPEGDDKADAGDGSAGDASPGQANDTAARAAAEAASPEDSADAVAASASVKRGGEENDKKDEKREKEPPDLTVVLETAAGGRVSLVLSKHRPVPPVLESRFTKYGNESGLYGKSWEPVLQTYEIPLAAFAPATEGFEPAKITAIRFVFDRTASGVVVLDDIGFARRRGEALEKGR